jgi:tetratricopeptide (TPR) repeat protein
VKKIIITSIVLLIISCQIILSQNKIFDSGKVYRQAEITKDKNGVRYSTIIRIGFSKQMFDVPREVNTINLFNFSEPLIRNALNLIKQQYGEFIIVKTFPNSSPNDTISFSPILNKNVKLIDLSQRITLKFNSPVPIDTIIEFLTKQKHVQYAIGPWEFQLAAEPNDQYFQISRWAFDKTELTKAWDITKSNSSINIAVVDVFGNTINTIHSDLQNKVSLPDYWSNEFGGHGLLVAGIAGALTNNSTGVSSSGWNSKILFEQAYRDYPLYWGPPTAIDNARLRGAHIINCSFCLGSNDDDDLRAVILNAIRSGVIVLASAGNTIQDLGTIPSVQYPAAYHFGSEGQVLAIAASVSWDGTNETKVSDLNYSPGTDPIGDPVNSFIDFAAPGGNYSILNAFTYNSYAHYVNPYTSLSTPFASGIIALLKSIKTDLTANQCYDILKNTADKIGADSYISGWNRYLGYGRINAYKALKYTLENYGGTLAQTLTVPSGETWNFQPGVTVKFASGASLIVNGTLNAVGNSTNKITFTRSGSSGTWGGIKFNSGSSGSVQYCDISYANYGVHLYISPSSIVVSNNTITNGSVGIYCHQTTSTLLRNIITGQSSYGLSSFDSDVYLTYNGQGNNVIRNNNYGVQSGYESVTYLSNGNNCVHNNTNYEVYAIMYSVVNAENTWWNYTTYPYFTPSDFWIQYYSTVDADPNNLRSDPNNCPLMKSTNLPSNGIITGGLPIDKEIIEILEKEKEGRYEEAIRKYKEKLKENIAIGEKGFILSRLAKCYIKTNRKDFTEYLNTEIRSHIKSENELYGYSINAENLIMLAEKKYEKAVDNYTIIRNNYSSNEQLYKWSTYNLGMLNSYQLNKAEKGKEYFRELIEKYPEDELSVHSRIQIGEMDGYVKGAPEGKEIATESKQTEYTIDNYPNPFNPTTTIRYQIPQDGHISLKVYDMLGREVAHLVNEVKRAGAYTVSFSAASGSAYGGDGRKLSSGVYIYKLVGNNVNISRKMLLIK